MLDRTKEPGAVAEPLFQDVVTTLHEGRHRDVEVTGGRYGLGSKEFTPAMAAAVLAEAGRVEPRRRFTVGIVDDVTHLSLAVDDTFQVPDRSRTAVFYALGSDGTVGANKESVKILAPRPELHAQGYFVYDSKKSGSMTVSHLRFGPDPIRSTYLIEQSDFVACHHFGLLERFDVLESPSPVRRSCSTPRIRRRSCGSPAPFDSARSGSASSAPSPSTPTASLARSAWRDASTR